MSGNTREHGEQRTVDTPITLSNGTRITFRALANGAQEAIAEGRIAGEMTHAEYSEYCAVLVARNAAKIRRAATCAGCKHKQHGAVRCSAKGPCACRGAALIGAEQSAGAK